MPPDDAVVRIAGLDHVQIAIPRGGRAASRAHIGLVVEDVTAARVALEAAGVATADDESTVAVRRFYAFDPFGNRLEFIDRRDRGFTDPATA